MSRTAPISRLSQRFILLSAAIFATSCESPQKTALRELSKAGIQPSGSALVEAVTTGQQNHIDWLLAVGVHNGQRNTAGHTPLRIAIEKGNLPAALSLIEAGADVNATCPEKIDILGIAVQRGESAMVEKLLQRGAKADGLMPNGEKILPWAIRNGRLAFVRSMLLNGADPHLTDEQGNPLLHIALHAGHRDLVQSLIQLGADPGATDPQGETTLSLAIKHGWLDTLPALASAGADLNLPDRSGQTLLDKALAQEDTALVSQLLKLGADPLRKPPGTSTQSPLEKAIAAAHLPTIAAMLEGRHVRNNDWQHALWLAYEQNNQALARLLLQHGIRASAPCSHGLHITEATALAGRVSWLKMFLDYGHHPRKSIYYAIRNGDHLTADFLLAAGAPADITLIPRQDTALSVALRNGHDRLAAMLLDHGANSNLSLPEKQKPLHLAIVTGNHKTVKRLLAAGADPNEPIAQPVSKAFLDQVPGNGMKWYLARDRHITPIMLAVDSGVIPSVRHLLDAGAKKNAWTRVNRTWPINFAARRGDIPMMRFLLGQDPKHEERHIIVSLSKQTARLLDADGNEILTSRVSTGRPGKRTPTGEFVITDKRRHHISTIYRSSMPYFQRLSCSDFGFHQGALPGYPASAGCIRLPANVAARLFTLTKLGDRVSIVP